MSLSNRDQQLVVILVGEVQRLLQPLTEQVEAVKSENQSLREQVSALTGRVTTLQREHTETRKQVDALLTARLPVRMKEAEQHSALQSEGLASALQSIRELNENLIPRIMAMLEWYENPPVEEAPAEPEATLAEEVETIEPTYAEPEPAVAEVVQPASIETPTAEPAAQAPDETAEADTISPEEQEHLLALFGEELNKTLPKEA